MTAMAWTAVHKPSKKIAPTGQGCSSESTFSKPVPTARMPAVSQVLGATPVQRHLEAVLVDGNLVDVEECAWLPIPLIGHGDGSSGAGEPRVPQKCRTWRNVGVNLPGSWASWLCNRSIGRNAMSAVCSGSRIDGASRSTSAA